jgi:mRNA-degrading endonuclease RelE of RelBE toxin-antitoxin system
MVRKIGWLFIIAFLINVTAFAEQEDDVKKVQDENAIDYFKLGKWAKEKKLIGPAKQYFDKALELKPDYPEAQKELSNGMTGELPKNYFELVKECRKKLQEVQQKCANRFAELAKYCRKNNLTEEREYCLNEAIKYDYNCNSAREERNEMKIEYFGWLSKSDAEKVKKGLMEFNGKWLPKNEVERLRNNWKNAWELRSGHYLLRTDIPLKKAQNVLNELENFYEIFMNIFYGMEDFNLPFTQPLKVYYFKDKTEFNAHTAECLQNAKDRDGYYYHAGDQVVHTWQFEIEYAAKALQSGRTIAMAISELQTCLHECTHQLISIGTKTGPRHEPGAPHYWIIEGMPCLFETYKNNKGKTSFGNITSRIISCKTQVSSNNHCSLQGFVQLTSQEFQGNDKTADYYAQATGLTLFLIQHEKYKLRFLEYIIAVHKKNGKLDKPFSEFMNITDLGKLEKEWLDFVKVKM